MTQVVNQNTDRVANPLFPPAGANLPPSTAEAKNIDSASLQKLQGRLQGIFVNYIKGISSVFGSYVTSGINLVRTIPGRLIDNEATLVQHEKYAQLACDAGFDESRLSETDDFKRVDLVQNSKTGFSSSIYVNDSTNEVVIAYRCTDNKPGVTSDIQMIKKQIPDQYADAEKVYQDVMEKYPDAKITIAGYSLGGSLAQLIASTYEEAKAITFNAFGTLQVINNNGLKDNKNIINYTTATDIVCAVTPHPGITRTINNAGYIDFNKIMKSQLGYFNECIKKAHCMSNFTDLRNVNYVNENVAKAQRILLKEAVNLVGNFLKTQPALTRVIPNLFFA